jgi:hypothetical protein
VPTDDVGITGLGAGSPGTRTPSGNHDGRDVCGLGAAAGTVAFGIGMGRHAWPSHQYAPSGDICGVWAAIGWAIVTAAHPELTRFQRNSCSLRGADNHFDPGSKGCDRAAGVRPERMRPRLSQRLEEEIQDQHRLAFTSSGRPGATQIFPIVSDNSRELSMSVDFSMASRCAASPGRVTSRRGQQVLEQSKRRCRILRRKAARLFQSRGSRSTGRGCA